MRLTNKIALITGAASGIGAATAQLFAEQGASVILTDIDSEQGQQLCDELCAQGASAEFISLDVTNEQAWRAVETHVKERYQGLDILVNNAGIGMMSSIEELQLSQWRHLMAVNLDSVFLGCQTAIRLMKDRKSASIINVSSIYGIVADAMTPAYSASKGAVRSLTKSIALYCCERNYPIRCNSMHPGFIETQIGKNGIMQLSDSDFADAQTRIANGIAMKKQGNAVDIANGIVFLASEESCYMTGSEMVIDGGYCAQ